MDGIQERRMGSGEIAIMDTSARAQVTVAIPPLSNHLTSLHGWPPPRDTLALHLNSAFNIPC